MASIKQRNGHYHITVSCGYDIYGKKLIETTTFTPDPALPLKKQEKAVQEFAMDFERRVKNGYAMEGSKITLKEFADRWINEYARFNLEGATLAKYSEELNEKILPALGHLKLDAIKPHRLNAFYSSMLQDGARRDGKPGGYSTATVHKTHNVLSAILRTAVEWEILERNPCSKVKIPTAPHTADSIKFFTPEQTKCFLAYIDQPYSCSVAGHQRVDDTGKPYVVNAYAIRKSIPLQVQVLFRLAICSGMRKGELLALQWKDIDFDRHLVNVTKAIGVNRSGVSVKAPKTRTSYRQVAIPQTMVQSLQTLRAEQAAYRASHAPDWNPEDWLFTQADGRMMHYSTPNSTLQTIIKRYNTGKPDDEQLPVIPFHGLRHTSATLLIANDQNIKAVSSRLGHAQTSTTMNIYTHALRESDQKAAETFETLLEDR